MTDYEADLTGKSKSPAMAQTETTLLNNILDKISEVTVVDTGEVEDTENWLNYVREEHIKHHVRSELPKRLENGLNQICDIEVLITCFVKVVNEFKEVILVIAMALVCKKPISSYCFDFYLNNLLQVRFAGAHCLLIWRTLRRHLGLRGSHLWAAGKKVRQLAN